MNVPLNPRWPVLRRYDQNHLLRVALPLGGIGTGTISLGGRGDLRDWEVVNRPAKGFRFRNGFFALRVHSDDGRPAVAKVLEGPIDAAEYDGGHGSLKPDYGHPRFRHVSFHAAYPFGQVLLSDPRVPLAVRIEAFNPFVPTDLAASGVPAAVLRYVLINRTDRPLTASVCGLCPNFVGADGRSGAARDNVNTERTVAFIGGGLRGMFLSSRGVPADAEQFGNLALATTAGDVVCASLPETFHIQEFWDNFLDTGLPGELRGEQGQAPYAAVTVRVAVAPRGEQAVTFLLGWWFPNRMAWTLSATPSGTAAGDCVGNYYTTQYTDAWNVVSDTARALDNLEDRTLDFVGSFCGCDLPAEVKEAALCTLTALRTQTSFRTRDGHFFGWEGCGDNCGCCAGTATHVWNYEPATAFLFGDLARDMRTLEFLHMMRPNGLMSHRIALPLARAAEYPFAAADGQLGCLVKLYRDWHLSGDDALLRRLWPQARRALEFCWIPKGWDADQDGVMEGCQHNTLDIEYYGPNPLVQGWYLGALRACEAMARHLGDQAFADLCRRLFDRGRAWTDSHLFNGAYYQQEIRPCGSADNIAPGLLHLEAAGTRNFQDPEFQLGTGCLVDQMAGQCGAHLAGLGYLLDPIHVRTALRTVMRHNFRAHLFDTLCFARGYALNEEGGLLIGSFPNGDRPRDPRHVEPHFTEMMTGFEYTAAVGMLFEGQTDAGLRVFRAVRARFDGRKRNPFDEAECGRHYARAMASWGAVVALTGFGYSGVEQALIFAARDGRWFWSNGYAWGMCTQASQPVGVRVTLTVRQGTMTVRQFTLRGTGRVTLDEPRTLTSGQTLELLVPRDSGPDDARSCRTETGKLEISGS